VNGVVVIVPILIVVWVVISFAVGLFKAFRIKDKNGLEDWQHIVIVGGSSLGFWALAYFLMNLFGVL
jgi:hypothetical protein